MADQPTAAVLDHLLRIYPAPLSVDELVRELTDGSTDYDECAEIEAALRDLLGAGLLQRHGSLLLPTRAAVLSRIQARAPEGER